MLTLILDDIFSGVLGAVHMGFDVAGVSPTPMLLGFISMFGVGGLLGLHGLDAGVGGATLAGIVAGVLGSVVVFAAFKLTVDARVDAIEATSKHLRDENARYKQEVDELKQREADRHAGELEAAKFYNLVHEGKRVDIVRLGSQSFFA